MTEACFVLLLGSGLCLTFSAFVLLHAIKTMKKCSSFFDFAWYLIQHKDQYPNPEKPEISD